MGIIPGLCRYSNKVADKYPWAVPDDPHSVSPQYPPNDAQSTPKKTSYLRPPENILKVRELCPLLRKDIQNILQSDQ